MSDTPERAAALSEPLKGIASDLLWPASVSRCANYCLRTLPNIHPHRHRPHTRRPGRGERRRHRDIKPIHAPPTFLLALAMERRERRGLLDTKAGKGHPILGTAL